MIHSRPSAFTGLENRVRFIAECGDALSDDVLEDLRRRRGPPRGLLSLLALLEGGGWLGVERLEFPRTDSVKMRAWLWPAAFFVEVTDTRCVLFTFDGPTTARVDGILVLLV